jgi:hypothetical protein
MMNKNKGAISAPLNCLVRPVVLGKFLFEFMTFQQWINVAQRWFRKYALDKDTICLDEKGRVCTRGIHFQRARDENTFPIKCYEV